MAFGCSGGQSVTPVTPNGEGLLSESIDSPDTGPAMMGLYQINVDTNTMTGSVEPIRAASAYDVLESVDITGLLTTTPCKDCVKIFNIGFNADYNLVLGMGIRHPFQVGDPGKPITAKNRADIHVFNVEGILITDKPGTTRFSSQNVDIATGNLVNPDGYTRYLDTLLDNIFPTQTELHPYVLHFDDYSTGNFSATNPNGFADLTNPTGNLVMKMGSDYSVKDYIFDIPPGEPISFVYAVGCTYGFSANNYTERFNPIYRMPQFNKKAASEVHVSIVENELKRGDLASQAILRIEVMDINNGVAAGGELNQMLFASDVAEIGVYAPSVCPDVVISNPPKISGDGRNTPLVYEVTLTNLNNARSGNNPVLIKIKDSYPVRQNPNGALLMADIMGRVDETHSELGYIIDMSTYAYVDLNVIPCEPVDLRAGVTPLDIGLDAQGNSYIAYSDKQVWKYDCEYCSGALLYTNDWEYAGDLMRLDANKDGDTIALATATNC